MRAPVQVYTARVANVGSIGSTVCACHSLPIRAPTVHTSAIVLYLYYQHIHPRGMIGWRDPTSQCCPHSRLGYVHHVRPSTDAVDLVRARVEIANETHVPRRVIRFFPDINECTVGNAGCSQLCVNLPGSFECQCKPGYIMTYDSRTCEGK